MPRWLPVAAIALVLIAGVVALTSTGGDDGQRDSSRAGGADAGRAERGRGEAGRSSPAGGSAGGDAVEETPTAPQEPGTGDDSVTGGGDGSVPAPVPGSGGDPDLGRSLNARGFGLMEDGRFEEAVPVLQQAVAAFPAGTTDVHYAYALYNLGRALRLSGRPDEAIPVLERRLQIPDQVETVRRELEAARAAATG